MQGTWFEFLELIEVTSTLKKGGKSFAYMNILFFLKLYLFQASVLISTLKDIYQS